MSVQTGKKYYFNKQIDGDAFLGRYKGYCQRKLKAGKPLLSRSGEEFIQKIIGVYEYQRNLKALNKVQICTLCARAGGLCSWSRNLTPVLGWDAEQTFDIDGKPFSYRITDCPLYEEDAPTAKERRKQFKRLKGEFNGRKKDVRQDNSVE